MLARVIAGVDGSAESLAAAEWAAREAGRRGKPLRLVHAWTRMPRSGEHECAGAVQRYLARRVLREAEGRVRAAHPGLPVDDCQVEGTASTILARAGDHAELLVVGSRGRTGLAGFLVGSVARGVVAKATRPVVLVRAEETAEDEHLPDADGGASTRTGYRDVVLGIDPADTADEVIGFAFEAARLRQARLHAVYARLAPAEPGTADDPQALLSAALQRWREKYPDVPVVETVAPGRAQYELVRAATDAGLLVVGHRMATGPTVRRTGPVTHAVVHHVGRPVAVVPHD